MAKLDKYKKKGQVNKEKYESSQEVQSEIGKNYVGKELDSLGEIEDISIEKIIRNEKNTYSEVDNEAEIISLAEDIARNGLLHNLVVVERPDEEKYVLLSGERRWRALHLLKERELNKIKDGQAGDPAKYDIVKCRVIKNLDDERKELIILHSANLQTRGGAGQEAVVRNAMAEYRRLVKEVYGLDEAEITKQIADMSKMSINAVKANKVIDENLRSELKTMLDSNELSKRDANELVKLSQTQQKVVSDAILGLKDTFVNDATTYEVQKERAVKGFVAAAKAKTDKAVEQEVENVQEEIAAVISKEQEKHKAEKSSAKKQDALVEKEQRSYKANVLKECNDISIKIGKLRKRKIAEIRKIDKENPDDTIVSRLDNLIAELQSFKAEILEGKE